MAGRRKLVKNPVPLSERTTSERNALDRALYGRSRSGALPVYDPDYHPQSIVAYFQDRLAQIKDPEEFESKHRREWVTKPVRPPTLARWCVDEDINQSTACAWAEKYPEFEEAMLCCKDIQEAFIIELTAIHGLNHPFIMLLMKNYHGWTDKGEMSHRVGGVTIHIDEQDEEA